VIIPKKTLNKIHPEGENVDYYQADTLVIARRNGIEANQGGVKQTFQLLIADPGLGKYLRMALKQGESNSRVVTRLEQWG
jgi:hypothetical protein